VLPLIDYELKPCRMCGKCLEAGRCVRDEAFNAVYDVLKGADRIFMVCPQYATLPAKVVMLLEKFQEISYLNWCADNSYEFPLAHKPVGLIVHGGQTEEALPQYKANLLAPLAAILRSVGMQVVGVDEEWQDGAAFAITRLSMPEDSIFVKIEHDWGAIRSRVEPLVEKVLTT
ncbi:hypothetical protein EG834_00625, partial [bacterium]|nr:hypothetical protein [bacterium]